MYCTILPSVQAVVKHTRGVNGIGFELQGVAAYMGTGQDRLLVVSVHQDDWGLVLPDTDSLASTGARLD